MDISLPSGPAKRQQADFPLTRLRGSASAASLLLWSMIGIGVALRLFHFFNNRSLWIDETFLANSLIRMDFGQLAQPALEYEQKAPILFLWLCRLAVLAFGQQEMALRLVPLLCSLVALALFVPISRRLLSPLGAAVAVGLLAVAPPLIYHSVEIKQYSAELLATVLVLYLYTRYHRSQHWPALLAWAAAGAVLVWFSYASIFVLMAVAGALSLWHLWHRDWLCFTRQFVPFGCWLLSFALNYLLFTSKHVDSGWLVHWFRAKDSFLPLSGAMLKWLPYQLYMLLDFPLGVFWEVKTFGLTFPRQLMRFVPLACALVGLFSFFRKDRLTLLVLLFPLALTLAASALEKYPFYERLLVFLAPLLILVLARGCATLAGLLPPRGQLILPILLLLAPLTVSVQQMLHPSLFGGYKKSYFRDVFLFINQRYKPGEVVYIYWNQLSPYRYYKEAYHLRYTGSVGQDERSVSHSIPSYLHNVTANFQRVVSNRPGWITINDMTCGIGDFIGQPAWYYPKGADYGQLICKQIAQQRPLRAMLRRKKADAYFFGIPRHPVAHVQ